MLLGSRNITINGIAGALPDLGRLGSPVVDETGLTGAFDRSETEAGEGSSA